MRVNFQFFLFCIKGKYAKFYNKKSPINAISVFTNTSKNDIIKQMFEIGGG